jgi:peptide-methionine (S)-S-oxide reductase
MRKILLVPLLATVLAGCGQSDAATPSVLIAPPAAAAERGQQVAVFAGGCFWGMEAVFEHTRGVTGVISGYAGGTKASANYSAVSSEQTAHAEAVRVTYDPARISYGQLLQIYFYAAHDPTQLNRQTPDVGTSYRSAIFPQNAAQRTAATTYIASLNKAGAFGKPVATRIESGPFFAAEAYHQDFARRNPSHGYIQRWDVPKLAKFKAKFPGFYKG